MFIAGLGNIFDNLTENFRRRAARDEFTNVFQRFRKVGTRSRIKEANLANVIRLGCEVQCAIDEYLFDILHTKGAFARLDLIKYTGR